MMDACTWVNWAFFNTYSLFFFQRLVSKGVIPDDYFNQSGIPSLYKQNERLVGWGYPTSGYYFRNALRFKLVNSSSSFPSNLPINEDYENLKKAITLPVYSNISQSRTLPILEAYRQVQPKLDNALYSDLDPLFPLPEPDSSNLDYLLSSLGGDLALESIYLNVQVGQYFMSIVEHNYLRIKWGLYANYIAVGVLAAALCGLAVAVGIMTRNDLGVAMERIKTSEFEKLWNRTGHVESAFGLLSTQERNIFETWEEWFEKIRTEDFDRQESSPSEARTPQFSLNKRKSQRKDVLKPKSYLSRHMKLQGALTTFGILSKFVIIILILMIAISTEMYYYFKNLKDARIVKVQTDLYALSEIIYGTHQHMHNALLLTLYTNDTVPYASRRSSELVLELGAKLQQEYIPLMEEGVGLDLGEYTESYKEFIFGSLCEFEKTRTDHIAYPMAAKCNQDMYNMYNQPALKVMSWFVMVQTRILAQWKKDRYSENAFLDLMENKEYKLYLDLNLLMLQNTAVDDIFYSAVLPVFDSWSKLLSPDDPQDPTVSLKASFYSKLYGLVYTLTFLALLLTLLRSLHSALQSLSKLWLLFPPECIPHPSPVYTHLSTE